MTASPLLDVTGLSVVRGSRQAVRDVSITVNMAERVALVGPNAAGKTSLIAAIAGLLPASTGQVVFDGRPLSDFSGREIAKRIALVVALQESAPRLSVQESTALGRYPHTGPFQNLSAIDHEAVARAIAETGLHELRARSLGSLSAGERQRAVVARALAQEPRLLLLDEPSAHLDIGHGLDLFALLTTIAARGVAIVAVIHDLVAAAQWATRMVVMSEGRLVDDGPPRNVMAGEALGRAFGVSIGEARSLNGAGGATWRFERRSPTD